MNDLIKFINREHGEGDGRIDSGLSLAALTAARAYLAEVIQIFQSDQDHADDVITEATFVGQQVGNFHALQVRLIAAQSGGPEHIAKMAEVEHRVDELTASYKQKSSDEDVCR